jgi:hypothetical protein
VLPLLLITCGVFFDYVHVRYFFADQARDPIRQKDIRGKINKIDGSPEVQQTKKILVLGLAIFLVVTCGMMVYFGRWHQRGTLDAIHFLQAG